VPVEYLIEQLEKSGTCASFQRSRGQQEGMKKLKKIVNKYIPSDINDNIDKMIGKDLSPGKSCPSSIAYVLKNILKELNNEKENDKVIYEKISKQEYINEKEGIKNQCPECDKELRFEGGCQTCTCGWSKCE
jgi:fatty acid-binding protein DegV